MSYQYLNERERTGLQSRFDLLSAVELTASGYPIIQAQAPPFGVCELRGLNEVLTTKAEPDTGVHFFIDDYQFERVWRQPERYVAALSEYPMILSPDFSLYTNYPAPLQQWNHYRNQLIGAWFQAQGLTVIPTASWSDEASYVWCFDGLPEQATVAVSTVGVLKSKDSVVAFLKGAAELLARKQPTQLLIYGKMPAQLTERLQAEGVTWQTFAHGQAARMRGVK